MLGTVQFRIFSFSSVVYTRKKDKDKSISVTDREGPYCCETSRLPEFLDNRLTNGGEVVSLTRQSPLYP
jgi:hypothetical protein